MSDLKRVLVTIAAAAFAFTPAAFAEGVLAKSGDQFSLHSTVGNWRILADHTKMSCLAESVDANGNVVQMGLSDNREFGYLGVFTKMTLEQLGFNLPAEADSKAMGKPTDPTKGESPVEWPQELTILVNGHTYSGAMNSTQAELSDGYHGGFILANNPDFAKDVAMGQTMVAFTNVGNGVAIDLTGTHDAMEAAKACTEGLSG